MNRGYVRLWRKSLDAGWIRNHKLWAFWTWCLLKASHKKSDIIVGLQSIHLMPGQFVFGRMNASKETGLTEREIRTVLEFLKKVGNLTIKTTNKFSIITIINWNRYQGEEAENDRQEGQQVANKWPQTRIIRNIDNPPEEISEKIKALKSRYQNPELIDQAFQAIQSTRKAGKITNTVFLMQLQKWERFSVNQVESGIRIYLEKGCADSGKDEKYLIGIIRNQNSAICREKRTPDWL